MYCQEFWILNYTWLTWSKEEEEFGGLGQAEKKHAVGSPRILSTFLKSRLRTKKRNLTKRIHQSLRLKIKCELLLMMDFYIIHLSVTSISWATEVWEQPLLIKISEQSHVCRCLLCYYWKMCTTDISELPIIARSCPGEPTKICIKKKVKKKRFKPPI